MSFFENTDPDNSIERRLERARDRRLKIQKDSTDLAEAKIDYLRLCRKLFCDMTDAELLRFCEIVKNRPELCLELDIERARERLANAN